MFRSYHYDDCDGDFAILCSVSMLVVTILLAECIYFICTRTVDSVGITFTAGIAFCFSLMLWLTYRAIKDWRKQRADQP